MARTRRETSSSADEAGWAELARGRWTEARALFEDAVEAGPTPSALEGLSWAAWWLDDEPVVFRTREEAYRLYRAAGDAESAGRMAAWLAADALDFHGAAAVASGWLGRARRLLGPLDPSPAHGWLAFFEGYLDQDVERRVELGTEAADLGRRLGVADLEMLGLALTGSALVAGGSTTEGMRCLDEATATALADEASIPISGAWACCFLVSTCLAVRDVERAAEWCDRISEFAERYGSRYMLAFCRAEYGAVELWRGHWSEAEELLGSAAEEYARSRPAFVPSVLVQQAELRRRRGRAEEAERLLDEANAPGSVLVRGRIALDRGDARGSSELAHRYLRHVGSTKRLARVPGLELAVEARVAAGDLDGAAEAAWELRDVARGAGTAALHAAAALAEGRVAASRGDGDTARTLLEDAVDRFELAGAPFEAALARIELAGWLLAGERSDAAEREARVAVSHLTELAAEPALSRARAVLDACRRSASISTLTSDVTPRERDVLRLLAKGLTNREIADRLVVSEHTVHRHVTNILRKLGLPSRAAAAAYAVRAGLAGTTDRP